MRRTNRQSSLSPRMWGLTLTLGLVSGGMLGAGETFVIGTGGSPRVAPLGSGDFAVSWVENGDRPALRGRRFVDGAGQDPFLISQQHFIWQVWNDDLVNLGDRLIALWEAGVSGPLGEEGNGGFEGPRRRLLSLDGDPLGDVEPARGSLAAPLGSTYVVVGVDFLGQGEWIGRGQILDGNDQPVGDGFSFSAAGGMLAPVDLLALDDSFLIAWVENLEAVGYAVHVQAFTHLGEPLGGALQLAPGAVLASLAVGDGNTAMVTWGDDDSAYLQRLDAVGEPLGAIIPVVEGALRLRSLDLVREGLGYLLLWQDEDSRAFPTVWRNLGKRLRTDGMPSGWTLELTPWSSSISRPSATALGNNRVLATWVETDSQQIVGREIPGADLFTDGFESGDTSAWSQTVP